MNQEKLLSALSLCADETYTAACAEKCPFYGSKGGCMCNLLRAAREEIIFLRALVTAHGEIEEVLRTQVKRLREVGR